MRACWSLSVKGTEVAWVGPDAEVSPITLRQWATGLRTPTVLAIDDADRYGSALPSIVREICASGTHDLLILALHGSKVDAFVQSPAVKGFQINEVTMPYLVDSDISGLVDVLTKEKRLGLLGKFKREIQEEILREKAGRQLLVAMIEATSGKQLKTKIIEEWTGLDERGRALYAMIAVGTHHRYPLDREQLLLAYGKKDQDTLAALRVLCDRNIIRHKNREQSLRARHRLIADELVKALQVNKGNYLFDAYKGLAIAAAVRVSRSSDERRAGRFLRDLTNHDHLYKMFDLEGAEQIYRNLEEVLRDDHHFWLQRGSLHTEFGSVFDAEMFLNNALGLNERDPFVRTAHAYMRMKKAIGLPSAPDSQKLAEEAMQELKGQIQVRGNTDQYPAHVLEKWSSVVDQKSDQAATFVS